MDCERQQAIIKSMLFSCVRLQKQTPLDHTVCNKLIKTSRETLASKTSTQRGSCSTVKDLRVVDRNLSQEHDAPAKEAGAISDCQKENSS